jgi:hypothetical protein
MTRFPSLRSLIREWFAAATGESNEQAEKNAQSKEDAFIAEWMWAWPDLQLRDSMQLQPRHDNEERI